MQVKPERMTVVPVGVDPTVFRPIEGQVPVPGRIMVTSSSDVPMKGLVPMLEAVAKLRTEREVELVVIGRPRPGGRVDKAIERLGLGEVVRCVSGISDDELARLYGESEVAVVPSLYEGFSLPAVEAMAWRPPAGHSPRWSAPTARPASWSHPTTRAPWRSPSGGCSTTPSCVPGSARPDASACCTASPGR
jgi:glycosyltransferase involved in cell wall biosynthesis